MCAYATFSFSLQDHRLSAPNASVHHNLPEEQMVPSSGSLLVSNDKWPPDLCEEVCYIHVL